MSSGAVKAGGGFLELFLKTDKLDAGLKAVSGKIAKFSAGIGAARAVLGGLSAAVIAPLKALADRAAESGDKIAKMSGRTNTSVEALSELGFAAEQSGQDIDLIETALTKMQKTLGGATGSKALAGIGLTFEQLKGMSPDKQMEAIADAIAKIQDPAKKTAALMQIFGRSGTKLGPMFQNGAAGIEALREKARELGIVMSQDRAKAAEKYVAAWKEVGRMKGSIMGAIGGALVPLMTRWADTVLMILTPIRDLVREHKDLVVIVFRAASAIGIIGAILGGVATAGLILSGVIAGFATIMGVIGAIIGAVLSPLGLLIAAVVGVVGAFLSYTDAGQRLVDWVVTAFPGMLASAKEVFGGITDALMAGNWALAGEIAMNALKGVFLAGINSISKLFGGAFNDMIGKFGAQIVGGDFAGAWNTVIAGMSAAWAMFSQGVLQMWASVAGGIVKLWSKTTEAISNKILELATDDGIVGQALSKVLGVDMAEEKRRSDRLNQEAARRGLAQSDFGKTTSDAVREQIQSQADAMNSAIIDPLAKMANNAAAETQSAFDAMAADAQGGSTALDEAIAANQARLAELIASAKQLREQKEAAGNKQFSGLELGAAGLSMASSAGTFSGFGAGMLGQGVSVFDKLGSKIDKTNETLESIDDKIEEGGLG